MDGKHILRPFTPQLNNHILWVNGGGGGGVGATEQNPWLPPFWIFQISFGKTVVYTLPALLSPPFIVLDKRRGQLPQKPQYEAVSNPPSAGLLCIYLSLCSSFRWWWFAFMNTKWQLFVTGCWRHSTSVTAMKRSFHSHNTAAATPQHYGSHHTCHNDIPDDVVVVHSPVLLVVAQVARE